MPRRPVGIAAVIPCHNGQEFLEGAILSALMQTRPVTRIVVVDDASTDGSREIAERYRNWGYPVTVVAAELNVGPASARNMGVARSDESFVAFLDADDRWTEDHCEVLGRLLEEHQDAALAFSRARSGAHGYDETSPSDRSSPEGEVEAATGCEWLLKPMLFENLVTQSAVMVRRTIFEDVGGYTDGVRHSEDYDLWLRMAHDRPFAWSEKITCSRLVHGAQASLNSLAMYTGAWRARERYEAFAMERGSKLATDEYMEPYLEAYERDLRDAWQSRSLRSLAGVLKLGNMVPGAAATRARWTVRAVLWWPIWRLAALVWDTLPDAWRASARRALKPSFAHRSPIPATVVASSVPGRREG